MSSVSVGFRPEVEDRFRSDDLTSLLKGNRDARALVSYLDIIGARAILDRAQQGCLLEWKTHHLVATPLGFGCPLPDFSRECADSTLSRFALLRREGSEWRLESGRSPWTVELSPDTAARLMSGGATSEETILLCALGMLAQTDHEAAHWQFHERYFVQRSQLHLALERPRRETAPPPNVRRGRFPMSERITLPVVAEDELSASAHFAVTESRRTVRDFAQVSVPLDRVGSLLWHTLRVIARLPRDESDHMSYEAVRRPVPSGGGMHAIDTWIYTRRVEGVTQQWWWYDPDEHELVAVPSADKRTPPWSDESPVHIIFTVDHDRVSWKYGAIAHSLEQKDVGVIMHAIQLGAVALGMGVWPQGASDSAGIGRLLGLDTEIDVPLGELALGMILTG